MKIGSVIIARYNSTRLSGKVLKDLHGIAAIEHTYNRLSSILSSDQIVIATSVESTDDPIVAFAKKKGWNIFRGSLENVAERFLMAGEYMQWDYLTRINGDNIFIDLECLAKMYAAAATGEFDFLTNVKNRTYPKGMSIEITKRDFYKRWIPQITNSEEYMEHVTLAFYENDWGNYRFFYNTEIKELQGIQLALDTKEDFERIDRLITILGDQYAQYTLSDIKTAYEQLER
jgi:spore coat polysaccharide biosynthesis protein SpsF